MSEFTFQTLRESIVSAIRSKILTGELAPGMRIVEKKLAEEFGSSRGPIREALRHLEQEGLVEYSRNVGCSVKTITIEDVYEIYLLRSNLEMLALRHYDCQFTDNELASMREILDDMLRIQPGNLNEIAEQDNRFHRIIVQKAGMSRLLKYWEELNHGSLIAGVFSGPYRENLAQRQNVIHAQLLEILAQRNTDKACQAVYDHYMRPLEKIMRVEEEHSSS